MARVGFEQHLPESGQNRATKAAFLALLSQQRRKLENCRFLHLEGWGR